MPNGVDALFEDFRERLLAVGYVADAGLTGALVFGVSLNKAIFLEGDAGVGTGGRAV